MGTRTDLTPIAAGGARRAAPGGTPVERLRAQAEQLLADLRRADRFFRLRAGIVGAWAILSVATL
jgi:hypothetical protein